MAGVRPFVRDDIPAVGDLFIEIFRKGGRVRRAALLDYFERVYFESPWYDSAIPSLVYEDRAGSPAGFFGVLPRPMRLHGKSLRAAVPGNLMIRPDGGTRGDALAALALVKEFLRGDQDLSFTDTASEDSRKLWERCGGTTVRLYSLRWVRPIRPFAFGLDSFVRKGSRIRSAAALTKPLCSLADLALRGMRGGPFGHGKPSCRTEPLQIEQIIERLSRLPHYSLVPHYEPTTFAWLLEMAASKRGHGELRSAMVVSDTGTLLGWFVYFLNTGGTCEVLQIVADTHTIDRVFGSLLEDAGRNGANALAGRLDPLFMNALSGSHCAFRFGQWALAHARDPRALEPFQTGYALFSGLEGEQWTRFVGDAFED